MAEYTIILSSNQLADLQDDYQTLESVVSDILEQARKQGYHNETEEDEEP